MDISGRTMLDELILSSLGRFITVEFYKKDGSLRTLTGRLGVKKHLKGGVSTHDPLEYITIYDVVNKGYRAINRYTIRSVTVNKTTYVN
jgi:hypothetical protein